MNKLQFRQLIREEVRKVLKEESEITASFERDGRGTTLRFGVPKSQFNRIQSKLESLIKQKSISTYWQIGSLSDSNDGAGVYAYWKRGQWSKEDDNQYIDALKSVGINVLK